MEEQTNFDEIIRVLQPGDLVRITGSQTKLKGFKGYLGRIVRVVAENDEEPSSDASTSSDKFKYDIDLELGDKIHGIDRSDLHYAPEEETRVRRKRKPNSQILASNAIDGKPEKDRKKAKQAAAPSKKKTKAATTSKTAAAKKQTKATTSKKQTKAAAPKKQTKKASAATTKKAAKAGATKKTGNQKSSSSSSKLSFSKKVAVKQEGVPSSTQPISSTNNNLDMYEKHKREFERSLARLQKADSYHFFQSDVPKEYDECYDIASTSTAIVKTEDQQQSSSATLPDQQQSSEAPDQQLSAPVPDQQESNDAPSSSNKDAAAAAQHETIEKTTSQSPARSVLETATKKASSDGNSTIIFPETAPYNFHIIKKRIEHGRYILNREVIENDHHLEFVTPYFQSIGRKVPKTTSRKNGLKLNLLHKKGIDWDLFQKDINDMCDTAVKRNPDMDGLSPGSLGHAAKKIKDLMTQIYEKQGRKQVQEMSNANDADRFFRAVEKYPNNEAAMQSKWRREAFPERCYERLETDAICAGLSELDARIASYELKTTLEDKFIGLSYTYNDTGQSEGWMKSLVQEAGDQSEREKAALAMANDDGVIKAQVAATMGSLLIAVQDRVMTELGVLEQKELKSANWIAQTNDVAKELLSADNNNTNNSDVSAPDIVEQPVWGIDCYTRRNITMCLETVFDSDNILVFIEKWLLPAINACPEDLAYNISNAARMLEGLPFDESTSLNNDNGTTTDQWKSSLLGQALMNKIAESGPVWLKDAASMLRRARDSLGPDFFRVHPKGHGSIVLCPKLEPNRLVTYYKGEVYPSWRWGEKMDAISMIQDKKGLKPGLPDFFNMALERPQIDPRGYGLLFVDASRKSGYGSMLSHSCQPSCEVRVAAVNGRLTLAMTTLKEMSIGDELTFDYNAVTESLNEYQAAICLCGHGQCRGSFLHFATADCYQQVLNRNSPIAVRLANLIKGSTKRVMSEEDDKILTRHGFNTAAFGAVSVNRRKASSTINGGDARLDSTEMVPVWLRTFVADTLRYIEYERRALPIALICNELFDEKVKDKEEGTSSQHKPEQGESSDDEDDEDDDNDSADNIDAKDKKPVKGSKPMPTFFFFARSQREKFVSILMEQEENHNKVGLDLKREIQKVAAAHWKDLDAAAKEEWKQKSIAEWEANGGREREELEKQRLGRVAEIKNTKTTMNQSAKLETKKGKKKSKKKRRKDKSLSKIEEAKAKAQEKSDKVSFHAADGEGISAMEQRIQQLTQTLSRVGRVLDRHREKNIKTEFTESILRDMIHSPLGIMPDEHVVAWMWNHEEGVVRTLMKYCEVEVCVSPDLRKILRETEAKYCVLKEFGEPWRDDASKSLSYPCSPAEARLKLTEALLKFREGILTGLKSTAAQIKDRAKSARKAGGKNKKQKEKKYSNQHTGTALSQTIRSEVQEVMDDMIKEVEKRHSEMDTADKERVTESYDEKMDFDSLKDDDGFQSGSDESRAIDDEESDDLEPWIQNFNKRFKLQKAADMLLLYAKTSTFFSVRPYSPLVSTPIEVYARELGNSVPQSVIDAESVKCSLMELSCPIHQQSKAKCEVEADCPSEHSPVVVQVAGKQGKRQKSKLCEPEDIVANVAVEYQGDYVVSQLLQWYNAGIDQKPGLPDMLGCVMLPSLKGCFTIDNTQGSSSRTDRPTGYQNRTRRRIVEWMRNSQQRGSPWPDDVRRAFVDKNDDVPVPDAVSKWVPLGSPILDFLVSGDDHNINSILQTLGIADRSIDQSDGLLSSVDHGRPAQAVSNWVQCENPDCQKWRKVPWHVDIDMIAEKFHCKDNVWNPLSASCDAPEDVWDESADAQVDVDGSAYCVEKPDETEKSESVPGNSFKLMDFKLGAKFDVQRIIEKDVWSVGTVVNLELTGAPKRVKFHFYKTSISSDEWINVESPRIATLYTKTTAPVKKERKEKKADVGARKQTIEESFSDNEAEESPKVHGDQSDVFCSADETSVASSKASKRKRAITDRPRLKKLNKKPRNPSLDFASVDSSDDSVDFAQQSGPETKEVVSVSKDVSCTVTDESSRDDSSKTHPVSASKPASNVWTIPKKKRPFSKTEQAPPEQGSNFLQQTGPRTQTVTDESSPDDSLKIQTKNKAVNNVWTIPKKKRSPGKVVADPLEPTNAPPRKPLPVISSDNNKVWTEGASAHGSSNPESDFQIARKAPNFEMQSIPEAFGEPSDDDGVEQGEISTSPRREPRERHVDKGFDSHDSNTLPEGPSRAVGHLAIDDRVSYSRPGDTWSEDKSPRRTHTLSHGSFWEDEKRDRKSYSTSYRDIDKTSHRRYSERDEPRLLGWDTEHYRVPSGHDYGHTKYSEFDNLKPRESLGREDNYDRRRHHAGDYEIPHEKSRRDDDYYSEKKASYYESRNIFQSDARKYRDDTSRYDDLRQRREEDLARDRRRDRERFVEDDYNNRSESRLERRRVGREERRRHYEDKDYLSRRERGEDRMRRDQEDDYYPRHKRERNDRLDGFEGKDHLRRDVDDKYYSRRDRESRSFRDGDRAERLESSPDKGHRYRTKDRFGGSPGSRYSRSRYDY